MNTSEKEERLYLEEIKDKLQLALKQIDENVKKIAKELKQTKEYLFENKTGMDHAEKISIREVVTQGAVVGENAVAKKKRLNKLFLSPYFGRIDFRAARQKKVKPIYIGISSFFDENTQTNLIHDWRAPIASMYYDFELGKANYISPKGKVNGNILLKRQYRIRYGKMEFMLENSMNIHDDILQKELSKSADDKMKNIVATIQRDQNEIIRNEESYVLIIQGVAGSGKTSIALHRIAFLLYRFKENISSRDILILSPNKVFADYISNVLPELGEDKIPEIGMEELASDVLENKIKFQTFFEQIAKLLDKSDETYKERIQFKASFEFLNKLNQYLTHIENEFFKPTDLMIKRNLVPQWFVRERFDAYHRLPLLKRFNEVAKDIEENIWIYYQYKIDAKERTEIRKSVKKMFKTSNLREIYKEFYNWIEKPEFFKLAQRSTFEYADIFPLIYLKIRLEGIKTYDRVKHLLVDEMQDYTPVQYAVITKLFTCKKTILGDVDQSVNPYSSSSSAEIKKVFRDADVVNLYKSYRSTIEITQFAQNVSPNKKLIPIERHGEKPLLTKVKNKVEEITQIMKRLTEFENSEHTTLGIVCKTQKQAENLTEILREASFSIHLLTAQTSSFSDGVIVTTAYMAKGLEFDEVIIPFATAENYHTNIDKSMFYIACTRAMHRLNLVYVKECTAFVKA